MTYYICDRPETTQHGVMSHSDPKVSNSHVEIGVKFANYFLKTKVKTNEHAQKSISKLFDSVKSKVNAFRHFKVDLVLPNYATLHSSPDLCEHW